MSDYNFNFGPPWFWYLLLCLALIGFFVVLGGVGYLIMEHIRFV